jgi:hypothetical protein
LSPQHEAPAGLHGSYRDVVRDGDGRLIWDSGRHANVVVADCRRLLSGFMHGSPTTASGITALQVGAGNPAWDQPPGAPPPSSAQAKLVDPSPFPVPRANLQVDYLAGATPLATPTDRLQIVASLGPSIPGWPAAIRTLREFGLVARLDGTEVLVDYVIHPAIVMDPSSVLERTIWLVF